MLTDLLLAIAHHLLMFALVIVLVMEMMLIRPDIGGGRIRYVARLDMAYGLVAGAIVLVGIGRVFFGLKGWQYYRTKPVLLGEDDRVPYRRPAIAAAHVPDPPVAPPAGNGRRFPPRRRGGNDRQALHALGGDGVRAHTHLRRDHGALWIVSGR